MGPPLVVGVQGKTRRECLRPQLVPGRPADAGALAGLAEEPAHGRAPAHPGLRRGHRGRRLLPRAARGGKAWDEAWLYKDDHYSNTDPNWGHPWDNFWASTRAPRRWRGLDAAPTTASADACARDVAREFHGGCLGTCGKTCDELGHDPVLFEKLKAAVKKWPDKGGGDAIPDACGFASQAAAERFGIGTRHLDLDPPHVTWITAKEIVAWLGVGLIYVVGVAAACCVSQPACLGYAHLQRLRNWVNRQIEDGGGARCCYFVCCGGWLELRVLPAGAAATPARSGSGHDRSHSARVDAQLAIRGGRRAALFLPVLRRAADRVPRRGARALREVPRAAPLVQALRRASGGEALGRRRGAFQTPRRAARRVA